MSANVVLVLHAWLAVLAVGSLGVIVLCNIRGRSRPGKGRWPPGIHLLLMRYVLA